MGRDGRIPRQGRYDEVFYKKLDEYLVKLSICKGRFIIKPLNKLTDQLAQDMATLADLTDDDVFWDISKRSIVSAWKAASALGAEQPDLDEVDGRAGGVAGVSRHVE